MTDLFFKRDITSMYQCKYKDPGFCRHDDGAWDWFRSTLSYDILYSMNDLKFVINHAIKTYDIPTIRLALSHYKHRDLNLDIDEHIDDVSYNGLNCPSGEILLTMITYCSTKTFYDIMCQILDVEPIKSKRLEKIIYPLINHCPHINQPSKMNVILNLACRDQYSTIVKFAIDNGADACYNAKCKGHGFLRDGKF